ncbi:tetratricopeptide repeat-containing glycosyltransferase family protein [Roseomonas sp. E05]|uniref:tetratricopeptide repeat-containing glycosyltransferase family protein n=1 Tax=Roseomonas sp. E05 TaxID=3046310 RepID=UPI0024BA4326|nr:tetratricopeptide repeat-containing glycosyltransferase family protein [Roseomonas sp. E05]MDJ0387715.1 tetratricopeptide repeat-containing glycosyltransferase family protein [Roseomonas sp. E05]
MHRKGDFNQAEHSLREALSQRPDDPFLWNALGVTLAGLNRPAEAVLCYRRALRKAAGMDALWTNLGNALTLLRQHETALACHARALALAPQNSGHHYNRGISLAEAGCHEAAAQAFTAALAWQPEHDMARWDRGRSLLHLGRLAEGWVDYEVRLANGLVPPRALPGRRWAGQGFQGQRLLIASEQGFGDTIWACRYMPLVKARGGTVLLECQPELVPLLSRLPGVDAVVPLGATLPAADWHVHQCSLPGLFTPDIAAIPPLPALLPDPARLARFGAAITADALRVGIVWSGSTTFRRNGERAQPLARFRLAFEQPGVQLYSLQMGPPRAELERAAGHSVIDLAPLLGDFADTAAAIAQLDLIIMTDSAVAHLAGTLGRPVWVLLGRNAHWLWSGSGQDSPWYPSLRLFRPRAEEEWDHVFDAAGAALMALAAARAG